MRIRHIALLTSKKSFDKLPADLMTDVLAAVK